MKIYIQDRQVRIKGGFAFYDIGEGYLLCIGTAEEVERASVGRLCDMIQEALAISRFHSIGQSTGITLH